MLCDNHGGLPRHRVLCCACACTCTCVREHEGRSFFNVLLQLVRTYEYQYCPCVSVLLRVSRGGVGGMDRRRGSRCGGSVESNHIIISRNREEGESLSWPTVSYSSTSTVQYEYSMMLQSPMQRRIPCSNPPTPLDPRLQPANLPLPCRDFPSRACVIIWYCRVRASVYCTCATAGWVGGAGGGAICLFRYGGDLSGLEGLEGRDGLKGYSVSIFSPLSFLFFRFGVVD
ncbi:hypothetical protein HOY82DRAFT_397501 [Tuber indicum]|nr:hypothetical protein HOY82DRAFT_397501 [Tuber indicum]